LRLAIKNTRKKNSDTIAHFDMKLSWGRLKKASQYPRHFCFTERIRKLRKLIYDNPPELLISEKILLASLGVKTRIVPMRITLYQTGRMSVSWELITKGRNDAIKWALLAPPSSGYKKKDVEDWRSTEVRKSDVVPVDLSLAGDC